MRRELLADVASHASEIAAAHGVKADIADLIGATVADHLAEHWGGQVISIPRDYYYKLSDLHLQIYTEFKGNNHMELVRKYGISLQWIYKLIKRVHMREMDKRQPRLFDDDSAPGGS
ncbi:MAG: Mor transcription activator family protein [Collimonas sp.]|uniref:Mor transcription activator family protein n=1 Tax=Collimonas sp. TaxID=1963772 RepID=UPI003265D499